MEKADNVTETPDYDITYVIYCQICNEEVGITAEMFVPNFYICPDCLQILKDIILERKWLTENAEKLVI